MSNPRIMEIANLQMAFNAATFSNFPYKKIKRSISTLTAPKELKKEHTEFIQHFSAIVEGFIDSEISEDDFDEFKSEAKAYLSAFSDNLMSSSSSDNTKTVGTTTFTAYSEEDSFFNSDKKMSKLSLPILPLLSYFPSKQFIDNFPVKKTNFVKLDSYLVIENQIVLAFNSSYHTSRSLAKERGLEYLRSNGFFSCSQNDRNLPIHFNYKKWICFWVTKKLSVQKQFDSLGIQSWGFPFGH